MVTMIAHPLRGTWHCRQPRAPHYHRLAGRRQSVLPLHVLLHATLAALYARHRLLEARHSSWSRR